MVRTPMIQNKDRFERVQAIEICSSKGADYIPVLAHPMTYYLE
jgi:hypothetical protein